MIIFILMHVITTAVKWRRKEKQTEMSTFLESKKARRVFCLLGEPLLKIIITTHAKLV